MAQSNDRPVSVPAEPELARVVAVRTGREKYRTDAMVRGHPIVVDEPLLLGGRDLGPTPFDLLCAAIGSCMTITLRMYADRKSWRLEEVLARVTHQRVMRVRADQKEESVDSFVVELEFRGDLDESQRTRLVEIAHRCPVHRALTGGVEIEARAV